MSGVTGDPLDRIEQRAQYPRLRLTLRCDEVLALVEVARAAREHYAEWARYNPPDLIPLPLQKIGAALARLDGAR